MPTRQSRMGKTRTASSPDATGRQAWPTDADQEGISRWSRFGPRNPNRRISADVSDMIPRLYRLSASRSGNPRSPGTETSRVTQWFQRLYSALPRRQSTNWEQFEQELAAPAIRDVRTELSKTLPTLDNRDIYSGIEGSSSWSERAKARAFSDAARIMGDLRSEAGARRKEIHLRQEGQERTEALGLLRLASDLAGRGAGAGDAAGIGARRIGGRLRIQDLSGNGGGTGDLMRTLLGDALRRRDSGTADRTAKQVRRVIR